MQHQLIGLTNRLLSVVGEAVGREGKAATSMVCQIMSGECTLGNRFDQFCVIVDSRSRWA
jgi:hypothetical protein